MRIVVAIAAALVGACASVPRTEPAKTAGATSEQNASEPADLSQLKHANDDDVPPARAAYGTRPFWRELNAQLHAAWMTGPGHPDLELVATVCFLFRPDGTIAEAKMDGRSGDVAFDAAATRAMADVQRARNEQPVAVPPDQLEAIQRMVCLRLQG